ncbi:metal-sensitive transcriptional regulator [Ktedonospora formicarum]|uniref:Transcriptional regulator n=1 Tax=Ktedonospora formicarum TaxID=2778364 RepID=A0A8J3MWM3_9CHLR|nr:metal-sensing transcriptional repressor [Ktedonospora formicarum]GHO48808.1 hypothetical protein KSX_69710 [Ktedonospora formicarum]
MANKNEGQSTCAEKQAELKRLKYIEGHLGGIRKMVDENKYCVAILHQTHAIRKAIEKLEVLLIETHLRMCIPEGIASGKTRGCRGIDVSL